MAVHLVILVGVKQVVNLTDERQWVLQFQGFCLSSILLAVLS